MILERGNVRAWMLIRVECKILNLRLGAGQLDFSAGHNRIVKCDKSSTSLGTYSKTANLVESITTSDTSPNVVEKFVGKGLKVADDFKVDSEVGSFKKSTKT